MKFNDLYKGILIESMISNNELIDTLKVYFLLASSYGVYTFKKDAVKQYINDMFDTDVSDNQLDEILSKITLIDEVNDDEVILYNEENDTEESSKKEADIEVQSEIDAAVSDVAQDYETI